MKPSILTILGSTRPGRLGEPVATWVRRIADARTDIQHSFVDLRDLNLPFFAEAESPSDGHYTNPQQIAWSQRIASADGFIVITPEYNHGYPGVLKNALDFLYAEWAAKPIGFVSYGGISGGMRSVEQLRQIAVGLQMLPISRSVNLVNIAKRIDATGQIDATNDARLTRFLDQLAAWVTVLAAGRKQYPELIQE